MRNGDDGDKYNEALKLQRLMEGINRHAEQFRPPRHLGFADETCPRCGGQIETIMSNEGGHPWRRCWPCGIKDDEIADKQMDALIDWHMQGNE